MKIGLSLTTGYPPTDDPVSLVRVMIERVEAAREAGFESLFVGDHHVMATPYFQSVPTIARLMPHAGDMRVGALCMLPLYQPVLLAEQLATLDVLSSGRFTLIAAVGGQQDAHAAFQIPWRDRGHRFEEAVSAMRALWSGPNASFQGRYYQFENVTITPRPVNGSLPVWFASEAERALDRTARIGDGWVANALYSRDDLRSQIGYLKEALARHRRTDAITVFGVRRDIHLATDSQIAIDEVRGWFSQRGYRGLPVDTALERTIVGSPDDCIKTLESLASDGFNYVLFRMMSPVQERALGTLDLLRREVVPHFRRQAATA